MKSNITTEQIEEQKKVIIPSSMTFWKEKSIDGEINLIKMLISSGDKPKKE